jgi:hypothetical protein
VEEKYSQHVAAYFRGAMYGKCFASIKSLLYNYEYLQKDVAPILELALRKSEMEE